MLALIPGPIGRPLAILCIGAHCDDIELGCGGTLRIIREHHPDAAIHWVVLCSTGERAAEARNSAGSWLTGAPATIEVHAFEDGYLPYGAVQVKNAFEELARRVRADVVFTHWEGDRHQDHRLASELTWNHFRNHLVLEYEIPKYDGDMGRPSVFVPVSRGECERKAQDLIARYPTQRSKDWLTVDTVVSLARLRGVESRSPTGYAEAFHCRKMTLLGRVGR